MIRTATGRGSNSTCSRAGRSSCFRAIVDDAIAAGPERGAQQNPKRVDGYDVRSCQDISARRDQHRRRKHQRPELEQQSLRSKLRQRQRSACLPRRYSEQQLALPAANRRQHRQTDRPSQDFQRKSATAARKNAISDAIKCQDQLIGRRRERVGVNLGERQSTPRLPRPTAKSPMM
jgi:hypothetical protein